MTKLVKTSPNYIYDQHASDLHEKHVGIFWKHSIAKVVGVVVFETMETGKPLSGDLHYDFQPI